MQALTKFYDETSAVENHSSGLSLPRTKVEKRYHSAFLCKHYACKVLLLFKLKVVIQIGVQKKRGIMFDCNSFTLAKEQ